MSFNEVPADAYDRFMGRYSTLLAPQFIDFAGLNVETLNDPEMQVASTRVLDVGCGTGALLAELSARINQDAIAAIDPSPPFIQAVRERYPRVDAREAVAEDLPFANDTFDVALSQLVVQFLPDPFAGLREMRRVTRHDGVVAASVWDFEGRKSPLSVFWSVARELDPRIRDEADQPGARKEHLHELFALTGLKNISDGELEATMEYSGFEEWWAPYSGGVGSAGQYFAGLDAGHQDELRGRCRARLPSSPFSMGVRAWATRGRVKD